jgi:hypothetical protein
MTYVKRTLFIIAAFMAAALIFGLIPKAAAAETGREAGSDVIAEQSESEHDFGDPFFQDPSTNWGFPDLGGFGSDVNTGWPDLSQTDLEALEGLADLNGDGKIDMDDLALLQPDEQTMSMIGEYLRLITGDNGVCSVGDYVWFDADKDGIQDPDEPGVNGVKVELYNWTLDRVKVSETVTAAHNGKDGWYSFNNLPCGLYRVKFLIGSSDYEFTLQDRGSDDSKDSDAEMKDGTSPWQLHAAYLNKDDNKIDAGVIPKTGGVPAAVFYSAGSGLILAGSLGVASPWLTESKKLKAMIKRLVGKK